MGVHSPGSQGGCLDSNILESYRKNSSGPVSPPPAPAMSLINIELQTL